MTEQELKDVLWATARKHGVNPDADPARELNRLAPAAYRKMNSTPIRRAKAVRIPPEDQG